MATVIDLGLDLVRNIEDPELRNLMYIILEKIEDKLQDHETRIEAVE